MERTGGLRVTHTSEVTPDQIDHLGHMNVRHYGANARAGTRSLLADLGVGSVRSVDLHDLYTRHHHEQLVGARLEVRSGVLGVDADSIRVYHELVNAETEDLGATFVFRVRSDVPLDHVDTVELPAHGAPRSIDLDAEPTLPELATVRELGLELRAERQVDEEDTAGGETVSTHLLPNLVWGGNPPDGTEHEFVHRGPDGQPVGWATMETRLGVHRIPALGTTIQSFAATTAIAEKVTKSSMWAYDVGTGEVLVTFEVVNILFDIGARRALVIPDDMRAEHEQRHHPELAPQRRDGHGRAG